MSLPTKRIISDFIKRVLSLRRRNSIDGVDFLRDLLRQNADQANLGASIYISIAEETYDVVIGDSYIQGSDDCTINFGATRDGQTVIVKGVTAAKTITLHPVAPTQIENKSGDSSVSGVACTILRYVADDDNWVLIATQ